MQEEPDNQSCWLGIAEQKEGGILKFFRKFRRLAGTKHLESVVQVVHHR
jgi:hypothetical protein